MICCPTPPVLCPHLMISGSANRLYRKGCTSSRVSGPPRLSSSTPTVSTDDGVGGGSDADAGPAAVLGTGPDGRDVDATPHATRLRVAEG
eukprot:351690-Chlamydomonas_euryale.AAC.1